MIDSQGKSKARSRFEGGGRGVRKCFIGGGGVGKGVLGSETFHSAVVWRVLAFFCI